jgi:hypothetical protein
MILGKLGKSFDPFVGVLLLHQIFRDSKRISQDREVPKIGKTML